MNEKKNYIMRIAGLGVGGGSVPWTTGMPHHTRMRPKACWCEATKPAIPTSQDHDGPTIHIIWRNVVAQLVLDSSGAKRGQEGEEHPCIMQDGMMFQHLLHSRHTYPTKNCSDGGKRALNKKPSLCKIFIQSLAVQYFIGTIETSKKDLTGPVLASHAQNSQRIE